MAPPADLAVDDLAGTTTQLLSGLGGLLLKACAAQDEVLRCHHLSWCNPIAVLSAEKRSRNANRSSTTSFGSVSSFSYPAIGHELSLASNRMSAATT